MKKKLRIVYMGTPDFAVAPLKKLIENNYEIVGVITAPDKAAGRGQKIMQSAVKKFADEQGLNTLQPTNLKNPDFIEELRSLNANFQIVVAFRMLPEMVWAMPEMGTMNLHASLLPQYRGAAPINWAIINGEKESGVSTFLLKHEIDTGDILEQKKVNISENMTAGELHDELMNVGAELVVETVKKLEDGSSQPQSQNISKDIKHAPKIFKEDCKIDWSQPIDQIHNFIRGLSPYPAAWSTLKSIKNDKQLIFKILSAEKEIEKHAHALGDIISDDKTYAKVSVVDGFIHLKNIQIEGKKAMDIKSLLNGFNFSDYKID